MSFMKPPMSTINQTLHDLAEEYVEYYRASLACDPSVDEYEQERFFEIQEWAEELNAKARSYGFTWEQVEDAGDHVGHY